MTPGGTQSREGGLQSGAPYPIILIDSTLKCWSTHSVHFYPFGYRIYEIWTFLICLGTYTLDILPPFAEQKLHPPRFYIYRKLHAMPHIYRLSILWPRDLYLELDLLGDRSTLEVLLTCIFQCKHLPVTEILSRKRLVRTLIIFRYLHTA